ncbi:hypothetical protein NicSoilB11_05950 [Arthrobacter sp. NicSoilB11]|nr:hypothetical protein NicSoilB11_05950 [Arthrobacter sp. NicSoilB11]
MEKGAPKDALANERPPAKLLAGSAHHVTDPLPGFFIHRTGYPRLPGQAVRLHFLKHHPAQAGEHGRGNHRQQHGLRIFSHSATLVNALRQLHNPAQGRPCPRFIPRRPAAQEAGCKGVRPAR